MENKLFTQYKAPVSSFSLREANQGLIPPGVYRGYDNVESNGSPAANIPVKLSHGQTSFYKVNISNNLSTDFCGVLVFPNGMIYHDEEEPALNVPQSTTGLRYHLIYATLSWVQSPGASSVTYHLLADGYNHITGNFTLPNPATDVAIGWLVVGVGTSMGVITYNRFPAKPLANGNLLSYPGIEEVALKNKVNIYSTLNTFNNHSLFNSLVNKRYDRRNSVIDAQGYLLINSPFESQELTIIGNGSSLNLYGFKHTTKPFGTGDTGSIKPGTVLRVSFEGIGGSSFFRRFNPPNVLRGFNIPNDIPIKEGILYEIRLDVILSADHGRFSVSSPVSYEDFLSTKLEVANKKDKADFGYVNNYINTDDLVVSYSFHHIGTSLTEVTIFASIRRNKVGLMSPTALPESIRPGRTATNSYWKFPPQAGNPPEAGANISVIPNGTIVANNDTTETINISVKYLVGMNSALATLAGS